MRTFQGRVAVVTGAASGIGRAMALRFAQEGMRVVLADVEERALQEALQAFHAEGLEAIAVRTDVSDYESVEALARQATEAYGAVHVLCNNAGVYGGASVNVWEHPLSDWQWVFGVNLWGVIHGLKAFVPLMLEHGEEGHIVNTASIVGVISGATQEVYSTSKQAVVRISEALYLQLASMDAPVSASVLCPGLVQTHLLASARNRPEGLGDEGSRLSGEDVEERKRESEVRLGTGKPPAEIAEHVFNAIRDDRFWILPHEQFDDAIRRRADQILTRTNPTPMGAASGRAGGA